jgi:hypothetical protein
LIKNLLHGFVLGFSFFQVFFKVAIFSVVHYKTDALVLDEAFDVSNDVKMIEGLHEFDFLEDGGFGLGVDSDFLGD